MQLTPRYGPDPLIVLQGAPEQVLEPLLRQRRRLASILATLDEEQWQRPSRCDGWSVRDVIVHLDSTNAFWAFSIGSGLAGTPTRFLADFDPAASPAELVAAAERTPAAEMVERFRTSTEALAEVLAPLDERAWQLPAEAPAGHLPIASVAHHALWDSWIHERDVLAPLGMDQELHDDEVSACLRWVAALGPAFVVTQGRATPATLAVHASDPDRSFLVHVGDQVTVGEHHAGVGADQADLELRGDAVELIEALSVRRPLPVDPSGPNGWLLTGVREVFDTAAP